MRRFLLGTAIFLGFASIGTSCSDDGNGEQLCDPGSNVFCRCRGTREGGTKQCNESGDGFGICETAFGECEEIEDPTSTGSGNTGSGGGPPDTPDPGELFAACSDKEMTDCKDGLTCGAAGYCTKSCESYEDCSAAGDCLAIGEEQLCAPYCTQQSDCGVYSETASCSFTDETVPPYNVVLCAAWGDVVFLPPDGYPDNFECSDDTICNLGFDGTERVCTEEGCADGCREANDCEGEEATCDSDGTTPGSCGGMMGESADSCPGKTVSLTAAAPMIQLSGDTSVAMPPSESEGEGNCMSSTPGEEDIYRVVVEQGGSLIVNIDTEDSSYDPVLYGRLMNCNTGMQFICADAGFAGAGEIEEFIVFDNDELWIIVDGYNGSTGSYTIDFDLTVAN